MSAPLERIRALCATLGACAENMDALRAAHPVATATLSAGDGNTPLWGGTVGTQASKINGEFYWFDEIEPVYGELDQLIRYSPIDVHASVFTDERIQTLTPHIHRLRAAYERDKELIQARDLVEADDGRERLKSTIEHESYWAFGEELRRALDGARHVLVAGSGPLPLTALCIGAALDGQVTCIERDAECHLLGRELIAMSGRIDHFDCINADILSVVDFDTYDAIVGVVLLGVSTEGNSTSTKATIASHIISHMSPGARMVLRDPHGLGKLLYPSVNLDSTPDVQISRHVPEVGPDHPYRSGLVIAERCSPDGGHAR